jgi:hypothetical protein
MAQALLSALWAPLEDGGLVELRPLATERPKAYTPAAQLQNRARRWLPLPEMRAALPRVLPWCASVGFSAYFGVLSRVRDGGRVDDTGPGAAVWADLDISPEDARARLKGIPFAPSAVVLTGRGVHAYWLLSEERPPLELAGLTRRMAVALGADMAPTHPAALLRLPGSINPKHAGRPVARLVKLEDARRYHAEDLDDWLPVLPKKPAPTARPARRAPIGPVSPAQLELLTWRRTRAEAALAALAERVATTKKGAPAAPGRPAEPGRAVGLYRAGCQAGAMVGRGELDRATAEAALRAAALASKLERQEVEHNLLRGLDRGERFERGETEAVAGLSRG